MSCPGHSSLKIFSSFCTSFCLFSSTCSFGNNRSYTSRISVATLTSSSRVRLPLILPRSICFSGSFPLEYGILLLELICEVSYLQPPCRGGGKGRNEGKALFVSEYAERGEWFVGFSFGDGSRDSKENCLARWCGVDGTELDRAGCDCALEAVDCAGRLACGFDAGSAVWACVEAFLDGILDREVSFDVMTERFLSGL